MAGTVSSQARQQADVLSLGLAGQVHLALEISGLAATSHWARIKLSPAAQNNPSRLPPRASVDAPDDLAHTAVPRAYFLIITAQVLLLDWLELHPQGHRRARFDGTDTTWLQT